LEKMTRTQVPLLSAYSSPFVLLSALGINILLFNLGVTAGTLRLLMLGAAVPIGFSFGRIIYLRRSHAEILFDDRTFRVHQGSRDVVDGEWSDYSMVSIILDQYGRRSLRLYKSLNGDHVDLPLFKTNAEPQKFRDHVQNLLSRPKTRTLSLQPVEAS